MKEWKNRTIDIFGIEWNIVFEDRIFLLDENNEESLVFGSTDHENHLVRVALHNSKGTRLSDSVITNVLYHELIHAILQEGAYEETMNESLVEYLAKGISTLVKQKVIGG